MADHLKRPMWLRAVGTLHGVTCPRSVSEQGEEPEFLTDLTHIFPSCFHSAPFVASGSSLLLVCRTRGLVPVPERLQNGAKGRTEARNFTLALRAEQQSLGSSQNTEAGGRQDQSTFRIIFEICSGKGSDVRY